MRSFRSGSQAAAATGPPSAPTPWPHPKRAFALLVTDPAYPGLHFKKLEGESNQYQVRIGLDYGAIEVKTGARAVWYWIGVFQRMPASRLISAGVRARW